MITTAQTLATSATRYQAAISNVLKFWHLNGQCNYCLHRADVKQLIEQEIAISSAKKEVKTLIQN